MHFREITQDDAPECGRILYEAFAGISGRHGFPEDFPDRESAAGFAQMAIQSPDIYGVAAEIDGKFVGSNFLWEHDDIAGVGPITVDPSIQAKGIGRKLMEAVIERGAGKAGIRLCQAAYNSTSMSLYTDLGFDIVEPLVILEGEPKADCRPDTVVRPLEESDIEACGELCRIVTGHSRKNELASFLGAFPAVVAEREGRIVGYMSAPVSWQLNHSVAETEEDLKDLIAGAGEIAGGTVRFLLPTRRSDLFRFCLRAGMRVVMPLSLMVLGDYREPTGAYTPSVLY